MLPTVTDVLQSVCLCWSQPQAVLKWLFGVWTWVGPRNHVQMGAQTPRGRGTFGASLSPLYTEYPACGPEYPVFGR